MESKNKDGGDSYSQPRSSSVIDSDCHIEIEPIPVFMEYLKSVAGSQSARKVPNRTRRQHHYRPAMVQLLNRGTPRGEGISSRPGGTNACRQHPRTIATAVLTQNMMYERLEELGLDYAVVYPTLGLRHYQRIEDSEMRCAYCTRVEHHEGRTVRMSFQTA